MVGLTSSKLFRQFSEAEIKNLCSAATERCFSEGEQIFNEGDPGDGLYIIREGRVVISVMVNGASCVLSHLGAGDIFGEMAVIDNEPRSASATAECDTTAFFLPCEEVGKMVDSTPKLLISIVRETSRRLRDFNKHYVHEVLEAERLALVGRFTASIVHDLKNPLNIISLSSDQIALPQSTPEMRATATKRTRRQVERISNLINELLEFTRGSPTSMQLTQVDYATFVHQLVEEVRLELSAQPITIHYESQPPSVQVPMNPARLSRVFYNMMHNATDAMPGGGQILLRFTATDREVITEIEDTGPGIPAEMSGKLFEPFATFGKSHGTGLGLSISKRIIEDHRGRIYARPEPDRGAIFGFTLPLSR